MREKENIQEKETERKKQINNVKLILKKNQGMNDRTKKWRKDEELKNLKHIIQT